MKEFTSTNINYSANPSSREIFSLGRTVLGSRKIPPVGWFIYCFPIVFLVGVAGNILAVVVLRRKAMKTSSSSIYLLFLALADTTVLCLSGFKTWLKLTTGFELMHTSDCSCRLILYGFYSATHISAWIIVLVTAERLLVVHCPLKAGHAWLVRRPGLTILILAFVILIINTNILYTSELAYYVKNPKPQLNASTVRFQRNSNFSTFINTGNITIKTLVCSAKRNSLITNLNFFIYFLLPSIILFSFNVVIIRTTKIVTSLFSTQTDTVHNNICSSDHKQESYEIEKRKIEAACHNPCLIGSPKPRVNCNDNRPIPFFEKVNLFDQNCQNSNRNMSCSFQKHVTVISQRAVRRQTKECSQQRLTLTLLALSFCWLLFSFPYSLIDSEFRLFRVEANIRLICFFLMYINHAVNFYLYCFLRQKFRNELRRCFDSCSKIRVREPLRIKCFGNSRKKFDGRCRDNLSRNLSIRGLPVDGNVVSRENYNGMDLERGNTPKKNVNYFLTLNRQREGILHHPPGIPDNIFLSNLGKSSRGVDRQGDDDRYC